MVYKKFIKRGGKLYGPYLYKSIKKDGKVITKYLGPGKDFKTEKEKRTSKRFLILGGISLILILAFFFIFLFEFGITGKVSLEIEDSYQPGEQITGNLKLNLKYGEFVPASTKVVIDNSGDVNEFLLSDLISGVPNDGIFYIENKDISGSGQGYGVVGEKIDYPEVSFTLKILEPGEKFEEPEEEIKEEPIVNETIEEPTINETTEEEIEEIINETVEENVTIINETTEELETNQTEEAEEIGEPEEAVEPEEEEVVEEVVEKPAEEEKEKKEKKEEKKEIIEEEPEPESESSLITGEVIYEKGKDVIKGTVTADSPFTYDLEEDQTVKIIRSSQDIDLIIDDGVLTITTDYTETYEGFGEEYLTDEVIELNIDLSQLNLIAQEDGELNINFVYDGTEFVSAGADINVEEAEEIIENITEIPENITEVNITEINITEENITIIVNETVVNVTITGNITINTTQYGAVLGKPVKWKKEIKIDEPSNITVKLPKQAENITVYKITGELKEELEENATIINETAEEQEVVEEELVNETEEVINETEEQITNETTEENITIINETGIVNETTEEIIEQNQTEIPGTNESEKPKKEKKEKKNKIEITAQVISGKISAEIDLDKDEEKSLILEFFSKLFNTITGRVIEVQETQETKAVIIEENATEFEIEYETPGPVANETDIYYGKKIVISSEVHYENILAFTELPHEVNDSSLIRFYHVVNETKSLTEFNAYDTDNNSLIDYIEWVVPSLSNQTYELIIALNRTINLALYNCVADYPIKYAVENGFSVPENINVSVGVNDDSDVFRMRILEFNEMQTKKDKYRIIQIHRLCSETIGLFAAKDSDLTANELEGKTIAIEGYKLADEPILKDVLENKYNLNLGNINFVVEEPFSALSENKVDAALIGNIPTVYLKAEEQYSLILQVSEDYKELYGKYPAKDAWIVKKDIDNETAKEIITLIRDAYNFAYDNKKDMAQKYHLETGIDESEFFDFADSRRTEYADKIDLVSQDTLQDVIDIAKKHEEINESLEIGEVSINVEEEGGLSGLE